jgi:hypothetical protein
MDERAAMDTRAAISSLQPSTTALHLRNYVGVSQLTIHGVPNRSMSMPKRFAQKVSCNGIRTVPPSASAVKILEPHRHLDGDRHRESLRLAKELRGCIRTHQNRVADRHSGVHDS